MNRLINIISICTAAAAGFCFSGCEEEVLVEEKTVLSLSYTDATSAPNLGSVTITPEITSGEPSDFSISEIFFGESAYKGDEFSIDPDSGDITVEIGDETGTGDYIISVTCISGGQKYILKNVLTVTVISGMPEQLAVDPATMNVRYEDLQPGSSAETGTAKVVTTGTSSAITGYEIRNLRIRSVDGNIVTDTPVENEAEDGSRLFFDVSEDGMVSLVKGDGWKLATYIMDIKVNTESFGTDSEEGLIANAFTVNVSAEVITVTYPSGPEYIAPNLSRTYTAAIDGPEEGGPQVGNFTITGIKLDGAEFTDTEGIFSIDGTSGNITASAGADIAAGEYSLSISYEYAGQTLLSTDALVIECRPGVPESITVNPSSASIELPNLAADSQEELQSFRIETSGTSAAVTGYEITDIKLNGSSTGSTGLLTIDPESGIINIVKSAEWQLGTYTVDVKVNTESFGTGTEQGTEENALTINVVEAMIFNYDSVEKSHKFATAWSVIPESTLNGAVYSFADASAAYIQYLDINSATGEISAVKGNLLPVDSYEVKVNAAVGAETVSASFSLVVTDNPYYFSYFSYGNNLGLSEDETDGVSQFRVSTIDDLESIDGQIKYTDLKSGTAVEFKSAVKSRLGGTLVDRTTGAISFTDSDFNKSLENPQMGVIFVTATTVDPEDSGNSFSLTIPVFVDYSVPVGGINVQYSPFAMRVNPEKGGRSAAPAISGADVSQFFLDYRRTFNYYNIDGASSSGESFADGQPSGAGSLLNHLWTVYAEKSLAAGSTESVNTGSKRPVSYYDRDNETPKGQALAEISLCYVDGSEGSQKFSVVVNPGVWYDNGWADGVFVGQMTFSTDLSNLNNGSKIFPFAIWLDKDFNEK